MARESMEYDVVVVGFDATTDAIAAVKAGRVCAGDVMVLRYLGPKGAPGMPEMLAPKPCWARS